MDFSNGFSSFVILFGGLDHVEYEDKLIEGVFCPFFETTHRRFAE